MRCNAARGGGKTERKNRKQQKKETKTINLITENYFRKLGDEKTKLQRSQPHEKPTRSVGWGKRAGRFILLIFDFYPSYFNPENFCRQGLEPASHSP